MRNLNSKKLSILVALVMMISMVAGMSVTAQAENNNPSILFNNITPEITQSDMLSHGTDTDTYIRMKKGVPQSFYVEGMTIEHFLEVYNTSNTDPDSITLSSPDNTHNPNVPYVKTIQRPAAGWGKAMITWVRKTSEGSPNNLINGTLDFAVDNSPANQWVKNVTIMTTN